MGMGRRSIALDAINRVPTGLLTSLWMWVGFPRRMYEVGFIYSIILTELNYLVVCFFRSKFLAVADPRLLL